LLQIGALNFCFNAHLNPKSASHFLGCTLGAKPLPYQLFGNGPGADECQAPPDQQDYPAFYRHGVKYQCRPDNVFEKLIPVIPGKGMERRRQRHGRDAVLKHMKVLAKAAIRDFGADRLCDTLREEEFGMAAGDFPRE
jgi:hypothetical protein